LEIMKPLLASLYLIGVYVVEVLMIRTTAAEASARALSDFGMLFDCRKASLFETHPVLRISAMRQRIRHFFISVYII
jgi:hypothetical protein